MDLNSIDLNLLKFLDALAQERSVTRAGLRLGLSQPAASRALGRLRAMLDDRLVARGQHGLELTPWASSWPAPSAACWNPPAPSFRRRPSIRPLPRAATPLPRTTTWRC